MGYAIVFALLLAIALTVAGSMLPALNFVAMLPGWSQVTDMLSYAFLFVDVGVFVTCLVIVVVMEQADLLWSAGMWVINLIKP